MTKIFTLLHPNAVSVATAIEDLYGERVILSLRMIDDDQLLTRNVAGIGGFGGVNSTSSGFGFGGNSTGFAAGGGRFSRSGFSGGGAGGGAFGFSRSSNTTGGDQFVDAREQIFGADRPLTPGQIERLEQIQRERQTTPMPGTQGEGVTTEAIRQVTQREPPIYVTLNRQHNLVIVRTSDADAMQAIEQLVLELDRPTPQVLLEMKILEITLDDNFQSIFDLQVAKGGQGPDGAAQAVRNPFIAGAATAAREVLSGGNFAFQTGSLVYQFLNDSIRYRISLLEGERRLNTIASPVLLASNNRPARIFVGEERVLVRGIDTVTSTNLGGVTTGVRTETEIRDIGTTLFLIPKINADRTVSLVISQDQSTVNPNGAVIPGVDGQPFQIDTVDTSNLFGTVEAKDGLTVAIGGLINETVTRTQQKVPILGDAPIVGRLFRREFDQDLKTELILLITPHVITTPSEGEAKSRWRVQEFSDHPSTEYFVPQRGIMRPGSRPAESYGVYRDQNNGMPPEAYREELPPGQRTEPRSGGPAIPGEDESDARDLIPPELYGPMGLRSRSRR